MANNQPLSPQGYNINDAPTNTNPFWDGSGGEPITNGLPAGGHTGQLLAKKSEADYDSEWIDPATGGVTIAQVRQITDPIEATVTANKQAQDATNVELWAAINENVPPDLTALTERVTTVETNLATEVSDRIAAIAALQAQIDEIEGTDITELTALVRELQEQVAALQETVDNLDLTQIREDITNLQGSVTVLAEASAEHATQIDQLGNALSAETTERESEITRVEGLVSANTANIASVAQRVTVLESWQAIAVATLDQLNNDLEAEATTRAANDTALGTRIDEVIDTIGTLPAQWEADINTAIDPINTELAETTAALESLTTTVSGFDTRITNAETVASTAQSTAETAQGIAEQASDDVATLEATFAGGAAGQVLTKITAAEGDYGWQTMSGGGGGLEPFTPCDITVTGFTDASNAYWSGYSWAKAGNGILQFSIYADITISDTVAAAQSIQATIVVPDSVTIFSSLPSSYTRAPAWFNYGTTGIYAASLFQVASLSWNNNTRILTVNCQNIPPTLQMATSTGTGDIKQPCNRAACMFTVM